MCFRRPTGSFPDQVARDGLPDKLSYLAFPSDRDNRTTGWVFQAHVLTIRYSRHNIYSVRLIHAYNHHKLMKVINALRRL